MAMNIASVMFYYWDWMVQDCELYRERFAKASFQQVYDVWFDPVKMVFNFC